MTPSPPAVRAIVARYAEATADNRVFFHPDIPEHRLAEALRGYPGIAPEEVLVLLDNTISGEATAGLVLTEDAIHIGNGSEAANRLALSDLRTAEFIHESPGVLKLNGRPVLADVRVRPETMERLVTMLRELAKDDDNACS